MITSVLVANRGEIARRVFATCRTLDVGTVAVFSDVDAGAPHVRDGDAAVRVPSYLDSAALIDAARRAGADSIHPGYGFLAENAAFTRDVLDAGLTWIGPSPEAIESMGNKIAAKKLMAAAGVAVLDELDPEAVVELPVIIKAAAGGGGRGMRIVRQSEKLHQQLESARAEAASAFGDPTVFCEPYLEGCRHIEVQVLADEYGSVWTLGERECSIQRRHQKVIEETPSPLVERIPGMRERLFAAARAAALAVGYVNAGTVEFLADEHGRFFFLEMNTRLQVEHPATEAVTGVDLVRWQLRVADGVRLDAAPPPPNGHAIEVRLYAEDPARGWQPQSGVMHRLDVPGIVAEFAPSRGLRLDAGVVAGAAVSTRYDPMLAKIVGWAPTRLEAAATVANALARAKLHGPRTNRDLLVRVLRHPAFLAGETDTAFLDRHDVSAPLAADVKVAALAAALSDAAANQARAPVRVAAGWRNVPSQPQRKRYDGIDVEYRLTRAGLEGHPGTRLVSAAPEDVVLEVDGVQRHFKIATYPDMVCVDSPLGAVTLVPLGRFADAGPPAPAGSLLAPMPGTVVRIAVQRGDVVQQGQPLLWLEAMKMEHAIAAPRDGVVAELPVYTGQQVDVGTLLGVVAPL
ncbi:MAG TPA: biotin carboxylase N-terminal domain-containing protein [Jatrophihabitantaceae bacterium]